MARNGIALWPASGGVRASRPWRVAKVALRSLARLVPSGWPARSEALVLLVRGALVSTSKKEPKALSKVQFGGLLAVLAVCIALAFLTMAGVAGKHGQCPDDPNSSRTASPTCWATYNNLDDTGVVGVAPKSSS
jgi:hypothetical protein